MGNSIKLHAAGNAPIGSFRFATPLDSAGSEMQARDWVLFCMGIPGESAKRFVVETDFCKAETQVKQDLKSVDKLLAANLLSMFTRASVYQQMLKNDPAINQKDLRFKAFHTNLAFIMKTIKDEKPIMEIAANIDAHVVRSFKEFNSQPK